MNEHAGALRDIGRILSLDTVDGFLLVQATSPCTADRGSYRRSEADFVDLKAIADAAKAAGGTFIDTAIHDEKMRPSASFGHRYQTPTEMIRSCFGS
ncbi:hypothetical protein ACI2J5_23640 [Agrobacterium pusense]|uniref:hypothetical protein n=1 Tax=Agrobacterium pusense TaxID=648995 RepID=UPI00384F8884